MDQCQCTPGRSGGPCGRSNCVPGSSACVLGGSRRNCLGKYLGSVITSPEQARRLYHWAMASDQRDWYRDWWRKKTGYVETASFRRPAREVDRERELRWVNWHPVLKLLVVFAVVVGVFVFVQILRRLV